MPRSGVNAMPEYWVWAAMIQRCSNPRDKRWEQYGGRGIDVCESWKTFSGFYQDMGRRPLGFSLDRKDNDQGYSPANCRWVPLEIQARNKRPYANNQFGISGVVWRKDTNKFRAQIGVGGKQLCLGSFQSLEDAIAARKHAEQVHWNNPATAKA